MDAIDPARIADALLTSAPGWARVSLTAPSPRLRKQAARELATSIVEHLFTDARPVDVDQLDLPI